MRILCADKGDLIVTIVNKVDDTGRARPPHVHRPRALAQVRAPRTTPEDDSLGGATAGIKLVADLDSESPLGLEDFSHCCSVW